MKIIIFTLLLELLTLPNVNSLAAKERIAGPDISKVFSGWRVMTPQGEND
jgi:hypothetical protein